MLIKDNLLNKLKERRWFVSTDSNINDYLYRLDIVIINVLSKSPSPLSDQLRTVFYDTQPVDLLIYFNSKEKAKLFCKIIYTRYHVKPVYYSFVKAKHTYHYRKPFCLDDYVTQRKNS